jgi:hypothetical protein
MKTIKLGPGFAIFILFFGIALFEAFRNQKWLMAGFWILMGLLFVFADNKKSKKENIDQ